MSQDVEEGIKRLFDASRPHFVIWVWLCDPEKLAHFCVQKTKRLLLPEGNPLHYASMCELNAMVKFLVVQHPWDVDSYASYEQHTPLHFASTRGHIELIHWLIKHSVEIC